MIEVKLEMLLTKAVEGWRSCLCLLRFGERGEKGKLIDFYHAQLCKSE